MKKIISLLLTLILMISAVPCASADGVLDALGKENFDRTADDAWDRYVNFMLEYNSCDDLNEYQKIGFGYYNFITGEEHYYNPDEYMVAASLYKVPLNMIFADGQEADARLGDTKLDDYQFLTLHHSSNEIAEAMFNSIGGYGAFKIKAKEYLLEDENEELPYNFTFDNIFTARQFIHCLKILGSDKERFPNIIDNMMISTEDNAFKRDVQWCPIANKNGYYSDKQYHTAVNDMGIVYTTQTFAIVMMTDNISNPNNLLADYCTLMCDYTNCRNESFKEHIHELMGLLKNVGENLRIT